MRPEDDSSGYVYNAVPWRYSGLSARVFGLDPLVALLPPLAIYGMRSGWCWLFYGLLVLVLCLFVYTNYKGYRSVRDYLRSRWIQIVGRGRWKTR